MKLFYLFLLIPFISVSQNDIAFKCYSLGISPINDNTITNHEIDITFTFRLKLQDIEMKSYNYSTHEYVINTFHYYREEKKEDGTRSFLIMKYENESLPTIIAVNASKYQIMTIDNENYCIFKYKNFEIIKE
ncbi:hypothetical protein [Flavobacterium cerinum]|uniref:Uncharacterized protein n=1 Tax=Flavobacterium cerinum TaxID=2502784 RepID=A0A444GL58_9FLAO|nr:hypothetical protein [Flavobacterium cerinum]RWW91734.1 hypothetical protein EPI11_18370 [Flavobacterium cerinum]